MNPLPDEFQYTRHGHTKDGTVFYLRPAAPPDAEAIIANIQAVCSEQVYLCTDSFVLTEEWKQALAHSVDADKGHLLVVAQVEQEIVGHLRLFAEWYGLKGRHVGDVGISIVKNWRERGIGTVIMEYALGWAQQARFQKLTASVIATNQRALNLFAKFNFVQEGRRARQFNIAGQYVDEILLGWFTDNNTHPIKS